MARSLVTRAVEVRVSDASLSTLLNQKFVEEFRRAFPGAKFALLRIAVPRQPEEEAAKQRPPSGGTSKAESPKKRPRYEAISIGHYAPDHDEKRILTLDCEDPDTLEAVERVLSAFVSSPGEQ